MKSQNISLSKAANLLKKGEVVIIPTETVYGLAASIKYAKALRQIFVLKKRPFFDPLIVHVSSLKQAQKMTHPWPKIFIFLANKFWPGPLTFILPKKKNVHPLITAGGETVAVRCPKHPLTLSLLKKVGPLAAPSANLFKRLSPTKAIHASIDFPHTFYLEGGSTTIGIESTIIGMGAGAQKDSLIIHRPGKISRKELQQALKEFQKIYPEEKVFQLSEKKTLLKKEKEKKTQKIQGPGSFAYHYMPPKPLFIIPHKAFLKDPKFRASLKKTIKTSRKKFQGKELILPNNPLIAARVLYQRMRLASEGERQFSYLIKKRKFEGEAWEGIWDRLVKASSFIF